MVGVAVGSSTMTNLNPIESAAKDYSLAARGYSTSQLAFYLEDARKAATKLLQLGVSESTLDEIWYKYN